MKMVRGGSDDMAERISAVPKPCTSTVVYFVVSRISDSFNPQVFGPFKCGRSP